MMKFFKINSVQYRVYAVITDTSREDHYDELGLDLLMLILKACLSLQIF